MSLRVRFSPSHRERLPEWAVACITFCLGLTYIVDCFLPLARHSMDGPFFAPLRSIMPQMGWGVYTVLVGGMRLSFLSINGTRPRGSTVLRAVGAGLSGFFWFGLVIGAMALPWASGAVWTYGCLMALDAFACYYAATEIVAAWRRAGVGYGRG